MSRGSLFVIAAPSGAGKTSLVNEILKRDPSLRVSVSHTTRKPRPHEESGKHYHFVSVDEFKRLLEQKQFLEHAQVFDNFYGTGRAQVEALRDAGHDVILEIDSVIVNQDFEDAVGQLLQVLRGSRDFASTRQSLKPLVAALLA